jgi:hypothetical protein
MTTPPSERALGLVPNEEALDPVTRQVMTALGGLGVAFPTPIAPEEVPDFPADLTAIGLDELGRHQGLWGAMVARWSAVLGALIAQKRSLKFQASKLRGRAKVDERDALRLAQAEHQLIRVEGQEAVVAGLVEAYKSYYAACSREVTRRQLEVELSR